MARTTDHFRPTDLTIWGGIALGVWTLALLGAGLPMLLPEGFFASLHATRLEGANVTQLRQQVAKLGADAAKIRQDNQVLVQRLSLSEQQGGELARRIGALEVTMPRLIEAANVIAAGPAVDHDAVTGSTDKPAVTSFDVDGGSVRYTTTPLTSVAAVPSAQPMPRQVTPEAVPDAAAFGVALGPPIGAEEGEDAWQSVNARVGTMLVGLAPILGRVEGGSGRRLIAGPIASEAVARELCGRMAKIGIACASVPFLGEPLPLLN